jgi:hypothetical protein
MLTEKDYCDYDTCVALKELGYVGICDAYYELIGSEDYNRDSFEILYTRDFIHPDDIDRVAAPLLCQAQKWLREEKKLIVLVGFDFCPLTSEIVYNWVIVVNGNTAKISSYTYDDFEEALSEGIKEAVKILKEK